MHGAAGVEYAPMMRLLCAAACLLIALNASVPAQSRGGADARNMELVGHNDLNGGGDGGEGLALHIPKGYLYFAMAFSVGVEMVNIRLRRLMDTRRNKRDESEGG